MDKNKNKQEIAQWDTNPWIFVQKVTSAIQDKVVYRLALQLTRPLLGIGRLKHSYRILLVLAWRTILNNFGSIKYISMHLISNPTNILYSYPTYQWAGHPATCETCYLTSLPNFPQTTNPTFTWTFSRPLSKPLFKRDVHPASCPITLDLTLPNALTHPFPNI